MVKSEATLRISFITRLQLILWESVILGVDFLCQVRDDLKKPLFPKTHRLDLSRTQAGFMVLFLIFGALGGLMSGIALACITLYR